MKANVILKGDSYEHQGKIEYKNNVVYIKQPKVEHKEGSLACCKTQAIDNNYSQYMW